MYIYEQENWPKFHWNEHGIAHDLVQVRHSQGRLIGGMEAIGFHLSKEKILETLTLDVLKTSEIEGEILDQNQVRSSVAKRLGIDVAAVTKMDKNVDGIVEMMLDATQNFEKPLTQERLLKWHSDLFPTIGSSKITVGAWRTGIVQVISGQIGKERIHFEAPHPNRVEINMELFFNWVNKEQKLDPVLKSAIAHLWFVTIHPFDDGNGRIARAIADMLLARSENSAHRFYSLSAQIQSERKHYYDILERTQKGSLDITPWIKWFLGCLKRAIEKAIYTLSAVINKTHYWESISQISLNERQRKIINRMLDGLEGHLSTSKWAKMAKCSQDTAHRDIVDLINKGILVKNPEGGRSTTYSLISLIVDFK